MKRVDEDETREERIAMEIIVDAYGPEEQAIGWYSYLDDTLRFPFKARCIEERRMSPLQEGETIQVDGIAAAKDCRAEMFVMIRWMDRELGVPLMQLEPIDADSDTEQAVADWRYWVGRGYQFC